VDRVLCLDAKTGTELGFHASQTDNTRVGYGSGPRATPTVHEGRVYALGTTGTFVCLGTKDPAGAATELLWQHDLTTEFAADVPQWGFASSPLIEGDLVVVQAGGRNGSVVAFNRVTGALAWTAGSEPNGYSSPVAATLGGERMIVAVTGKSVVGIRPSDGRVLWSLPWETQFSGNIATPLVIGDYVFVSSSYSKGCMLVRVAGSGDAVRAERVYFRSNRVMRNHHSTCVYRDGYLYGFDDVTTGGRCELRCVDLRKGEAVEDWIGRTPDNRDVVKGSLILADKYLLGLTQTGTLFLADADPKEFLLRGQVPGVLTGSDTWALPVLVDGRIYLRDATKVVCLDAAPVKPAER
jgi:outer membrane protein assembly factor BamB